MDKETLRSILSTEYQPAFWRQVLTDVFGATNLFQQPIPIVLPANELAENSFELGSFETADGRIVGLYQIDLKPNVRIGQNRVGVRSLLRSIYKYDVDAALVVFVQNDKWRLSLISEIRVLEMPLEMEVSRIIGKMPFVWLAIADEPGADSMRGYIERSAIALLSNFAKPPVDAPSSEWLGHCCNRERVRKSGLWNSNHVDESYDPAFLDLFEHLVAEMESRS